KDPMRRLRDIGEARLLLAESPADLSAMAPASGHRSWLGWAVAVLVAAGALPILFLHFREIPSTAEVSRFKILLPEKVTLVPSGAFAISPDGRKLMFAAAAADGSRQLWIRSMDSVDAHPLPGVDIGNGAPPGCSPDSRFLVYSNAGRLSKVDVA